MLFLLSTYVPIYIYFALLLRLHSYPNHRITMIFPVPKYYLFTTSYTIPIRIYHNCHRTRTTDGGLNNENMHRVSHDRTNK